MNRANSLKLVVLSFILTVTGVGCVKSPVHPTPIPNIVRPGPNSSTPNPPIGPETGPSVPPITNPTTSPLTTDTTGSTQLPGRETRDNFWVDRDTFKERTVYFDLDSSSLKPSEKSKADAVADYLKGQPTLKLEIEGHCDERGTDEYNRALGERRALSVREYLISAGVTADRVSTISFGEDKPAVMGHDESAWAKNRRGEFILLKPKT